MRLAKAAILVFAGLGSPMTFAQQNANVPWYGELSAGEVATATPYSAKIVNLRTGDVRTISRSCDPEEEFRRTGRDIPCSFSTRKQQAPTIDPVAGTTFEAWFEGAAEHLLLQIDTELSDDEFLEYRIVEASECRRMTPSPSGHSYVGPPPDASTDFDKIKCDVFDRLSMRFRFLKNIGATP